MLADISSRNIDLIIPGDSGLCIKAVLIDLGIITEKIISFKPMIIYYQVLSVQYSLEMFTNSKNFKQRSAIQRGISIMDT